MLILYTLGLNDVGGANLLLSGDNLMSQYQGIYTNAGLNY